MMKRLGVWRHSIPQLFTRRTTRRLFSESASIVAGHFVVVLIGLFGIRLLTELAPMEVYGEANLLLGALGLGLNIFVSPITATQSRFHSEYMQSGSADLFTREVGNCAVVAVLALTACGIAIYIIWCAIQKQSPNLPLLGLATGWLIFTSLRNVLVGRLNAERRQGAYARWISVEALLTIGATTVALLVWARTEFYICGQLAGLALTLVIFVRLIPHATKSLTQASSVIRSALLQRVVDYGLPFAPLSLLGWLSNLVDRYVLVVFLGAAAAGQYIAAFAIASRAMLILGTATNDILRPILFDAENQRQPERARKVFNSWLALVVLGGGVILGVIALGGGWISELLLAESYRSSAVEIMIWIGAGYGAFIVIQALENRILSLGRSQHLIFPQAIGAVGNVIFSVVLIATNGVIGAAQASAASFGLQLLVTGIVLSRTQRVDFSQKVLTR